MYKLFILFVLFFSITLSAKDNYTPFIVQQMSFIEQMNENNITKERIKEILSLQKQTYDNALDEIMSIKRDYLKNTVSYENEIFALNKIIKINDTVNSLDQQSKKV